MRTTEVFVGSWAETPSGGEEVNGRGVFELLLPGVDAVVGNELCEGWM
jgi:hypothetical protein